MVSLIQLASGALRFFTGALTKVFDVTPDGIEIGAITAEVRRILTIQAAGGATSKIPLFLLKLNSVAHGMTSLEDTHLCAWMAPYGMTNGGAILGGASGETDTPGVFILGIIGVETPSAAGGAVCIAGAAKSGTAYTALAADKKVIRFLNSTTELAYFLGNGKLYTTSGHVQRTVTDAGPMTATPGTQGEIVFNTSDSKFYGCTVTHGTAATWAALN